ncbi:putative mitochondrial fission protein Tbfis1p [Pyronema omphalodes]|nr:putative mitochondrial fission protein Tbfis1p [Pyronema omphalodes]
MTTDHLPYAIDAESPLKDSELAVLRKQYEAEGSWVGVQTKFNYSWGLIKSTRRVEQQLGVRLLTEIFRDHVDRRRECLYYLALGHYKLGNYAEARRYNDILIQNEPTNPQAESLKGLIEEKVSKEGLLGVAIVSGVALTAGLFGSLLWKGLSKRR